MVYSAGYAVQRALGVIMLPLYTRAISPAAYGSLGILLSVSVAASTLFSAALDIWVVRTYYQLASDPLRREEALGSVWRFLVVYPLVASLALAAVAWPFLGHSATVPWLDVFLMLVAAALATMGSTVPLNVLRARQDLRGYLAMSAVSALATPALTGLFVVVLHQGIRGWFLAGAIANLATFAVAVKVVPWRPRLRVNRKVIGGALLFSLPLLPHYMSSWALLLADRLVIAGIVSASQLGLYSLASNLAAPIMILVLALSQGFTPTYAKAGAEPGVAEDLAEVVMLQLTLVVALTLAGAMLGSTAVRLLAAPDYHSAAPLVPWIVLGYGFLGAYAVPMSGATLGAGRRNFAWVATASSAVTNIGLLLIFVPTYGIYAAAVASAVGYFVLLVLMAIWAHARSNPVRYQWWRLVRLLTLAGGIYAAATLTLPTHPALALVVQIGWLVLFGAAAASSGGYPAADRLIQTTSTWWLERRLPFRFLHAIFGLCALSLVGLGIVVQQRWALLAIGGLILVGLGFLWIAREG